MDGREYTVEGTLRLLGGGAEAGVGDGALDKGAEVVLDGEPEVLTGRLGGVVEAGGIEGRGEARGHYRRGGETEGLLRGVRGMDRRGGSALLVVTGVSHCDGGV